MRENRYSELDALNIPNLDKKLCFGLLEVPVTLVSKRINLLCSLQVPCTTVVRQMSQTSEFHLTMRNSCMVHNTYSYLPQIQNAIRTPFWRAEKCDVSLCSVVNPPHKKQKMFSQIINLLEITEHRKRVNRHKQYSSGYGIYTLQEQTICDSTSNWLTDATATPLCLHSPSGYLSLLLPLSHSLFTPSPVQRQKQYLRQQDAMSDGTTITCSRAKIKSCFSENVR